MKQINKEVAVSNKILHKYEVKKNYLSHKKRLASISGQMNITSPYENLFEFMNYRYEKRKVIE